MEIDKYKLGLDIGVGSVGFALIKESESGETGIVRMGVRIVTEDPKFHGNYYTGNSASKNADRTKARSYRRSINRYQLRRDQLIRILNHLDMMPDEDMLTRISSLELFELRDRAVRERIELKELGRIFYHLNQKRGFKSSRKSASEEENKTEYKKMLAENHEALGAQTIGQYFYQKLLQDPFFRVKDNIFYRTDYQNEFDVIWNQQKKYYPEVLTGGPDESENRGTNYRRIRNETIYYQRKLKSAKHLVSKCTFEPLKRVLPKSHPPGAAAAHRSRDFATPSRSSARRLK
jgi:CRISPR-associated endonuclease Csn1